MVEERKDSVAQESSHTAISSAVWTVLGCGCVGVVGTVGGFFLGGGLVGTAIATGIGACIFGKSIVRNGRQALSSARDYYRRTDPGVFDRDHTLDRPRGYDGRELHPLNEKSNKFKKALKSCGRTAAWTLGSIAGFGVGIGVFGSFGLPVVAGIFCAYKALKSFPKAKEDYLDWKNQAPDKKISKKDRSPVTVEATKEQSFHKVLDYTAAALVGCLGVCMCTQWALGGALGLPLTAGVAALGCAGVFRYFGPGILAHAKNAFKKMDEPQNQQTNQRTNQRSNQQTNQQTRPNLRARVSQQPQPKQPVKPSPQMTVGQKPQPKPRPQPVKTKPTVTLKPQPRMTAPKKRDISFTIKGMGGNGGL